MNGFAYRHHLNRRVDVELRLNASLALREAYPEFNRDRDHTAILGPQRKVISLHTGPRDRRDSPIFENRSPQRLDRFT